MELLIGSILLLGAVVLVAYPLLAAASTGDEGDWTGSGNGPRDGAGALVAGDQSHDLAAEKESVYASLADLEYDREMSKVSDEDYQTIREDLMAEAARIAELEDMAAGAVGAGTLECLAEAEIEAEALVLAEKLPPRAVAAAANTPQGPESAIGDMTFCPECGARLVGAPQRYCHSCGQRLVGR